MLVLSGSDAYPLFRQAKLGKELSAALGGAVSFSATWVYLLDAASRLSGEEIVRASDLLGAVGRARPDERGVLYISPRKGTVSPWSSKASDIFRSCGLGAVRRVERAIAFRAEKDGAPVPPEDMAPAYPLLHDRMTEGVYTDLSDIFAAGEPKPGSVYDVLGEGRAALERANAEMGLALSDDEIGYLADCSVKAGKNPTDTEIVMFGQVNSEHCRHKIFNASWTIDGRDEELSLFKMIRHTHASHPEHTLSAYSDNSGVIEGFPARAFVCNPDTKRYEFQDDQVDILMKVETHNHPTAISPFPGAATGVGGEIRDEAATGVGSRTKCGISGFMVSGLRIPGHVLPWEKERPANPRLASPLGIMLDGPIGGASFGNEFGRPQLCGFFRSFEQDAGGVSWGYDKPVMLAGGMGSIRRSMVLKKKIPTGSLIAQIGGPALRIGLGGGAASSLNLGANDEELDFNSVQRGNAEMQRRCQEVIDACVALGPERNPILSIHDIGAGGLSNGCPELVEETGGAFDLRAVHNEETSMSPMEIWCCEAQERYVLAIAPEARGFFEKLCERERCPVAFIGRATDDHRLVLEDSVFSDRPIDMEMGVLLGKPPRMHRDAARAPLELPPVKFASPAVGGAAGGAPVAPEAIDALARVLFHPTVADKTFLVTITDRTVTGAVHRDQMCGPYQLPVADNAVVMTDYVSFSGAAMACGERSPVAVVNAPASGRLAVAEAVLNIASAGVPTLGEIKLSGNWMSAAGQPGQDAALFDAVRAVAMEFCPALGLSIPVGKDSCSMTSKWTGGDGSEHRQISPLSCVISAFGPVPDVRLSVTPDLKPVTASALYLVDLARGRRRLGGSVLSQCYGIAGGDVPDFDNPADLAGFYSAFQTLLRDRRILAAHDCSDGGLIVAVAEMAMAGAQGVTLDFPAAGTQQDVLATLFAEEPGMVMQVADVSEMAVRKAFADAGLSVTRIGSVVPSPRFLTAKFGGVIRLDVSLSRVRAEWSETSARMRELRDNPDCAAAERAVAADDGDPGLSFKASFDPDAVPCIASPDVRPKVAILREEGVNGHVEMAAAFTLAGFEAVDVHTTDLVEGRASLDDFSGLVACGGFSYGDVLGAGSGWAKTILFNSRLRDGFEAFFNRPQTFTLGVCNGCQMVSQLRDIIPGAHDWPRFLHNASMQFEARFATVEVLKSPSVFLRGMEGSRLPIAVAHGEGFTRFETGEARQRVLLTERAALRYVDNFGAPTERYPFNPNGSEGGLTGFTTLDGRATIMMPHPERGFRAVQLSYRPSGFCGGEAGPWMRMFRNARAFVG